MIVAIYGKCGSGKTMIAKALARRLRIRKDNVTGIGEFRESIGVSKIKEENDAWLFLAGFLNEDGLGDKIYCSCGTNSREAIVERILRDITPVIRIHLICSKTTLAKRIKQRNQPSAPHFIYGIDYLAVNQIPERPQIYDLTLRTDKLSVEQCVKKIVELTTRIKREWAEYQKGEYNEIS